MLERFLDQIGEVLRLCEDTDGILVVNREGIIEYHRIPLNSYWCSQDTVGRHILELYPELDGESSTILTALRTGRASYNVLQDINNQRVLLESTTIPIVVDGRVECVVDSSKYHTIDQRVIRGGEGGGLSTLDRMLTEDPAMLALKSRIRDVAGLDSSVLIYGETGTGKELVAESLHSEGGRAGPFVSQNCAAIPATLLESLFFGTEKGSYTGALTRKGLLEEADGGTLFLDEVEGMSPALQVKLLRVLQEHEIMRVGGNKIISIDVRIVAATNESLEEKVRDGSFRRDLYYRLNTLPVLIPPLRQRGDDVFLLMERFNSELKGDFVLSDEVKDLFLHYSWPGNIRELRNLAEYFSFTGSPVITVKDLPPTFVYENKEMEEGQQVSGTTAPGSPVPWQQAMEEKGIDPEEYWFVLKVLYQCTEERKAIGREGILECAKKEKFFLSQIGVRTILGILKEYGLARVSRGRGGSRMTCLGREIWEHRE